MKIKTIPTSLIIVTLGVALFWAGCSSDSSTMSGPSDGLNLISEFGGYDASDEAPAFGDVTIANAMATEEDSEPVDDPIFAAGEVDSLLGLDGREVYTLTIRWGMLEFDSTVTTETDWTGGLALTHGYLHLIRPILFESGQDFIVRPRTDRQTLDWVSKTTVSFDGVIVTVIIPPVPEGEDWFDNALTFTTGPYTRTFTIDELAGLNEIVDVDNIGNQVAFNSIDVDLEPCGGGPLDGRWLLNPSGKNGNFYGRWLNEDGELGGFLRGHFGERPADQKVFFGKVIGLNGEFRGLLRGIWGRDTEEGDTGWFDGVWAGRTGTPIGKLGGTWSSQPPPDIIIEDSDGNHGNGNGHNPRTDDEFGSGNWTRGYFSGRWVMLCPTSDSARLSGL